jgi:hypothetical protein
MGLGEAAVVVYLRAVGAGGTDLTQIHEVLRALDARLLFIERQREAATLVMLLVPAVLFHERFAYRVLAFVLMFGVWDLSYYACLRGLIGWPGGWTTLDVLFLIPKPWIAPILCPALLAGAMVVFALLELLMARTRAIRSPHPLAWVALIAGTGLVLFSFTHQTDAYLRATDVPPNFSWRWFTAGYVLLVGGALSMLIQLYREPKARFF